MNTLNLILFIIGLVWTRIYLYAIIKKRYGIMSSISASAKKLKADGQQKLFFFYIIGLVVPWVVIGYDLVSVIAGSLLLIIGSVTGYNDNIKNDKVEDAVHVGVVLLSISIGSLWCILMNINYIFLVICAIVLTIIFIKKKVSHHTWWIEEIFTYTIYFVMFMERVLI